MNRYATPVVSEPADAGPGWHRFETACRGAGDDPEWRPPISPEDFP
jgi:hypothetical protein